jgi:hypothetical protein
MRCSALATPCTHTHTHPRDQAPPASGQASSSSSWRPRPDFSSSAPLAVLCALLLPTAPASDRAAVQPAGGCTGWAARLLKPGLHAVRSRLVALFGLIAQPAAGARAERATGHGSTPRDAAQGHPGTPSRQQAAPSRALRLATHCRPPAGAATLHGPSPSAGSLAHNRHGAACRRCVRLQRGRHPGPQVPRPRWPDGLRVGDAAGALQWAWATCEGAAAPAAAKAAPPKPMAAHGIPGPAPSCQP